ncbi:MAG: J domain-containing protein [Clostridia bacterium]|nr:J domain-containing protein [Clostridia bacterium]
MAKKYAEPSFYESKLKNVMARLGADRYDYDWSRHECWVEFDYKGQRYRFAHSLASAQDRGINIQYGSDLFAQVVLSLEDLARMVERSIYDLSTWAAGMKQLPAHPDLPACFAALQFTSVPTPEQLQERYRRLAKVAHPDAGGSEEQFNALQAAYQAATALLADEVRS